MSHDVFISHSAKDKTVADATCACLEQRGIRCWVAPRDIVAGSDWSSSIIDGINGAKVMVLILSKHSNVSRQVLREIERAANRGMSILPFRVDDTTLSKSLEYFLSSAHWLDAFDGELQQHLDLLSNNVAQILSRDDAIRDVRQSTASRQRAHRLPIILATCIVSLTAICGILLITGSGRSLQEASSVPPESASMAASSEPSNARAKLGMAVALLKEAVAQRLGAGEGGMWVAKVLPQQTADIKKGDIIRQIGDARIVSKDDFNHLVDNLEIGASYEVELIRNGESRQAQLTPLTVPSEKLMAYELQFGEVLPFGVEKILRTDIPSVFGLKASGGTLLAHGIADVDAWRREGKRFQPVTLPEGHYSCGNVSADGSLIVLAHRDTGAVSAIKVRTGQTVLSTGPLNEKIDRVVCSHNNAFILALTESGEVLVINTASHEVEKRLDLRDRAISSGISWESLKDAALTSGGRYLLTVYAEGCIVWDWQEDSLSRAYKAEGPLRGAALSEDVTRLAMFFESGEIAVWDNIAQKKLVTLMGHERGGFFDWGGVAFLSQRYLASVCKADQLLRIWDCETRLPGWEIELGDVLSLCFDGESKSLYSGSNSMVFDIMMPEFLKIADLPEPAEDPVLTRSDGVLRNQVAAGGDALNGQAVVSSTITLGDGSSQESSEARDGARITTWRSPSGEITGMSFQPAPESFGLGIQIASDEAISSGGGTTERCTEGAFVVDIPAGGQAARDGVILKGDVITAVIEREGGKPTPLAGLFLAEVQRLIVGREGSKVRLLVRRAGESELVEVMSTRGRMQATRNRASKSDFTNSIGMEFVAVLGGIGFLGIEENADKTMSPHYVRLSQGFLIGAHEVTQEEFAIVMSMRPSAFSQGGQSGEDVTRAYANGVIPSSDTLHHPVDSVSWDDAAAFCKRLSQKEGRVYRLPTEAEWEWACRKSGSIVWEGLYPGGDGLEETTVGRHLDFPTTTHPVGTRSPNAAGMHDTFGNVAEWCADFFEEDGFSNAAFVDPRGPREGFKRVVRGGSFKDTGNNFFKRTGLMPSEKRPYVGFRIVLDPTAGIVADRDLERSLLSSDRWDIDESTIPDPIPALIAPMRTNEEEQREADEIKEAIFSGDNLRQLRGKLLASAAQNQTQFDEIKHMWPSLCARMGRLEVTTAYAFYQSAKEGRPWLFDRARTVDPLLGGACNDMAWALSTNQDPDHRDPSVAIARAVEACKNAKWQYWGFLDTLAAALAAAGRYELAIRITNSAIERAPKEAKPELEHALGRYKQGLDWAEMDH